MARGPRGGRKATTSWEQGPRGSGSTSGDGKFLLSGQNPVVETTTIIRLRGHLLAYMTGTALINAGYDVSFGICMVENRALSVSAVPGPRDDQDWDGWILHRHFSLKSTGSASVDFQTTQVRLELDSKAMRKARDNETLVGIIQMEEAGSADMSWSVQTRLLSMLH